MDREFQGHTLKYKWHKCSYFCLLLKNCDSWVKGLFLRSGILDVVAQSRQGEWACAWEMTRLWPLKNLGTARNKVPSVHTAPGTSWGWAVTPNLLFLGKDGFQVWFLPLGVGQGQVTWGSQVFQACLRLRFIIGGVCGGTSQLPTSLASAGSSLASPVLWQSRGHAGNHCCCLPAHLLWELLGFYLPSGPKVHFLLAGISLGRFLVFDEPIFKIKNLFLEFCLTFFYSFWLLWHSGCRKFITK